MNGDSIDLYHNSEKLSDLININKFVKYPGDKRPGYQVFNMSLLSNGEDLRCLIRNSSFNVGEIKNNEHLGQESYISRAEIVDDNIVNERRLFVRNIKGRTPYEYHGLEDPRYFMWKGREYALCVKPDTKIDGAQMILLDIEKRSYVNMTDYLGRKWNKNWMPYVSGEELYVVSDVFPTIVYRVDEEGMELIHHTNASPATFAIHGSSNIFDYKGRKTALVHGRFQIPMASNADLAFWFYWHAFLQWPDNDWTRVSMGRPFFFENRQIEFCTSIIEHRDKFFMAYSVMDWGMNVIEFDYDELERLL